ncbi:MAG TPA: hypothetical protein VFA20_33850 [Myxococcaceae bacterium]|nr:hypothetical protein [Myxococcaceae bacterium]
MVRTFQHLLLTAALASALAPGAAWARFGKSDDRDKQEQKQQQNNDNGGGSSSEVRSSGDSHYHDASPVGAPYVDRTRDDCRSDGCCWRHSGWPSYWYEPSPAYAGYAGYSPRVEGAPDYGLRLRTELTGDVMPFSTLDGGSAGAQLRIEGPKWGFALEGRHIAVNADDGSGGVDHLSFFNGFVTYALLGNERGRLRLEAGGQSAFAPDLIVLSPAAGVSLAIGFGESFGVEAVARASLLPHVQAELAGGFTYALGPLGLRLGWRGVYLNDNGLVDGVIHQDAFSGPYFGVGMAF